MDDTAEQGDENLCVFRSLEPSSPQYNKYLLLARYIYGVYLKTFDAIKCRLALLTEPYTCMNKYKTWRLCSVAKSSNFFWSVFRLIQTWTVTQFSKLCNIKTQRSTGRYQFVTKSHGLMNLTEPPLLISKSIEEITRYITQDFYFIIKFILECSKVSLLME